MKKLSIFLLLASTFLCGNAQDTTKKYLVDLRLSFYPVSTPQYIDYHPISISLPKFSHWTHNVVRAEGNYQFSKFLRVGIWCSYGKYSSTMYFKTQVWGGGIKTEMHLLPLLCEQFRNKSSRFDLYASTELGGNWFFNKYMLDNKRNNVLKCTATIGGGAFFYVTKQIGIYVDYQYGGFLTKKTTEDSRVLSVPKVGLTLRF